MWRSPVAQRSGGPEVASSNLVIPTKSPKGLFFLSRCKSVAKVLLFFEICNSLDKNKCYVDAPRGSLLHVVPIPAYFSPKLVRLLRFPLPSSPCVFFAGLPRVYRGSFAGQTTPENVQLLRFPDFATSSFAPTKRLPDNLVRQPYRYGK